jgi:hypothetical protein
MDEDKSGISASQASDVSRKGQRESKAAETLHASGNGWCRGFEVSLQLRIPFPPLREIFTKIRALLAKARRGSQGARTN